jgi:hypothetical protein
VRSGRGDGVASGLMVAMRFEKFMLLDPEYLARKRFKYYVMGG